jgi:hypothetical protein
MKVIYIEPKKLPIIKEVKNNLETFQELVEGLIQVLPISDNYLLIFNEEGKLINLEPNFYIYGGQDIIFGNAVIVKENNKGDFIGLTNEECERLLDIFCHNVKRANWSENPDDYIKIEFIGD